MSNGVSGNSLVLRGENFRFRIIVAIFTHVMPLIGAMELGCYGTIFTDGKIQTHLAKKWLAVSLVFIVIL